MCVPRRALHDPRPRDTELRGFESAREIAWLWQWPTTMRAGAGSCRADAVKPPTHTPSLCATPYLLSYLRKRTHAQVRNAKWFLGVSPPGVAALLGRARPPTTETKQKNAVVDHHIWDPRRRAEFERKRDSHTERAAAEECSSLPAVQPQPCSSPRDDAYGAGKALRKHCLECQGRMVREELPRGQLSVCHL